MKCQPIIILGAARSGTNMLRDCLTSFEGVGTWPCDEINLIWRYGNSTFATDELTPAHATEKTKAYIGRAFDKLARRHSLTYVVEKTCANTLRVPFVDAVVPNAKYVYIVRDGRDVTRSAMWRWTAKVETGYILKKLRFVPPGDVPRYGLRFIANRWHQLRSEEKRQRAWGPRFAGFDEVVAQSPLAQVCALQWVKSNEAALRDLGRPGQDRVVCVRYEDFLARPGEELCRIAEALGIAVRPERIAAAVKDVRAPAPSKWRMGLDDQDIAAVEEICGAMLERLGYTP